MQKSTRKVWPQQLNRKPQEHATRKAAIKKQGRGVHLSQPPPRPSYPRLRGHPNTKGPNELPSIRRINPIGGPHSHTVEMNNPTGAKGSSFWWWGEEEHQAPVKGIIPVDKNRSAEAALLRSERAVESGASAFIDTRGRREPNENPGLSDAQIM